MPWAAAAIVGGSALIGGMMSADAAKSAGNSQARAADHAAQLQYDATQQARGDLAPFTSLGYTAVNPLLDAMGYKPTTISNTSGPGLAGGGYSTYGGLTKDPNNILNQKFNYGAFNFDPSQLDQAPGYQFALNQGLRAVNNSAAARGLGLSGAQLKGAADYTTGLADQTYGNQFNRALQQYQQNYNTSLGNFQTNYNSAANQVNRLSGLVQQGQNSAAQTGSQAMSGAANQGNLLTSGAAAQAAGTVGAANAYTNALSTGTNLYTQNQLLKNNGYGGIFGS